MQASTSWDDVAFSSTEGDRPPGITRFAAQYLARGLPCERFTAALASRNSCITRGRGGWLDLPRGGLAPPILCQLPGALRDGSQSLPKWVASAMSASRVISDMPVGC